MQIRPATVRDVPAVVAMLGDFGAMHRAWDSQRYLMPADARSIYGDWIGEAVRGEGVLALIVEGPAKEIIGYCIAEDMPAEERYWSPRCVYIHDIYLMPAARGEGVGPKLVAMARQWAKERGVAQVRALVARQNTAARAFFVGQDFGEAMVEMVWNEVTSASDEREKPIER